LRTLTLKFDRPKSTTGCRANGRRRRKRRRKEEEEEVTLKFSLHVPECPMVKIWN